MSSILDQILAKKREEIAALGHPLVSAAMMEHATRPKRSLAAALRRTSGAPMRVLAEIKRASPSAGPIRPDADPIAVAIEYEAGGAAAISVLTDRTFFDGGIEWLSHCRNAVKIPALRKDFLIAPVQLYESAAKGADAVLLIVAALTERDLSKMMRGAEEYKLEALVEVHSLAEADIALAAGATLLGVNHRDLHTFAIDMTLTEQIAKRVPADVVLVAESGIKTRDDVRRLGDAGAHAVLVGETLMRAPSPGAALRELLA
jgi:indole-3-glycerol phosphate synthase